MTHDGPPTRIQQLWMQLRQERSFAFDTENSADVCADGLRSLAFDKRADDWRSQEVELHPVDGDAFAFEMKSIVHAKNRSVLAKALGSVQANRDGTSHIEGVIWVPISQTLWMVVFAGFLAIMMAFTLVTLRFQGLLSILAVTGMLTLFGQFQIRRLVRARDRVLADVVRAVTARRVR